VKRATAERLIAQSTRIISEIEQFIQEIGEGEFDTILHHFNMTREAGIVNAQRETEPHRSAIDNFKLLLRDHPELFE